MKGALNKWWPRLPQTTREYVTLGEIMAAFDRKFRSPRDRMWIVNSGHPETECGL